MLATKAVHGELLDRVRQLPPGEFDAFIEQAISLRPKSTAAVLSTEETDLIERINRGLTAKSRKRFAFLAARRKKFALTEEQRQELLHLSHEAESQDADRAAALVELAKLRRMPLRILMKQMGIEARPVHG